MEHRVAGVRRAPGEANPQEFPVPADVRHRHETIDSRWRGVIEGPTYRSLSYVADGEALMRTMDQAPKK